MPSQRRAGGRSSSSSSSSSGGSSRKVQRSLRETYGDRAGSYAAGSSESKSINVDVSGKAERRRTEIKEARDREIQRKQDIRANTQKLIQEEAIRRGVAPASLGYELKTGNIIDISQYDVNKKRGKRRTTSLRQTYGQTQGTFPRQRGQVETGFATSNIYVGQALPKQQAVTTLEPTKTLISKEVTKIPLGRGTTEVTPNIQTQETGGILDILSTKRTRGNIIKTTGSQTRGGVPSNISWSISGEDIANIRTAPEGAKTTLPQKYGAKQYSQEPKTFFQELIAPIKKADVYIYEKAIKPSIKGTFLEPERIGGSVRKVTTKASGPLILQGEIVRGNLNKLSNMEVKGTLRGIPLFGRKNQQQRLEFKPTTISAGTKESQILGTASAYAAGAAETGTEYAYKNVATEALTATAFYGLGTAVPALEGYALGGLATYGEKIGAPVARVAGTAVKTVTRYIPTAAFAYDVGSDIKKSADITREQGGGFGGRYIGPEAVKSAEILGAVGLSQTSFPTGQAAKTRTYGRIQEIRYDMLKNAPASFVAETTAPSLRSLYRNVEQQTPIIDFSKVKGLTREGAIKLTKIAEDRNLIFFGGVKQTGRKQTKDIDYYYKLFQRGTTQKEISAATGGKVQQDPHVNLERVFSPFAQRPIKTEFFYGKEKIGKGKSISQAEQLLNKFEGFGRVNKETKTTDRSEKDVPDLVLGLKEFSETSVSRYRKKPLSQTEKEMIYGSLQKLETFEVPPAGQQTQVGTKKLSKYTFIDFPRTNLGRTSPLGRLAASTRTPQESIIPKELYETTTKKSLGKSRPRDLLNEKIEVIKTTRPSTRSRSTGKTIVDTSVPPIKVDKVYDIYSSAKSSGSKSVITKPPEKEYSYKEKYDYKGEYSFKPSKKPYSESYYNNEYPYSYKGPSYKYNYDYNYKYTFIPSVAPVIPPAFPGGGGFSSILGGKKTGRSSRYLPSVLGIVTKTKRSKKDILSLPLSGLEIRGLPT